MHLPALRSGARRYVQFCGIYGVAPFPVTEYFLCLFIVYLARSNLSFRTIKVYLFGIQFHSLLHGFPVQVSSMSYLFYTLRGIRRMQGNSLRRAPRNPITVSHLWTMFGFVSSSHFSDHDKAMWRSVVVLAFFGLLRVSEFTCGSTHSFDATLHISPSDVSFNPSFSLMYLRIKSSKTDPFRTGCVIRLASIPGHTLCPVQAARSYLRFRGNAPGPLFIFSDGKFLTRNYVVAFIRMSLPGIPNIHSHSFRIGGASAALSAGASDALIRVMGRWSSDCYNRYIRVSDPQVTRFQTQLAHAFTTKVWDSDSG